MVVTEVVTMEDGHIPWTRWYADGDFHQRPLHPTERAHYAGRDVCTGYTSRRDPLVDAP